MYSRKTLCQKKELYQNWERICKWGRNCTENPNWLEMFVRDSLMQLKKEPTGLQRLFLQTNNGNNIGNRQYDNCAFWYSSHFPLSAEYYIMWYPVSQQIDKITSAFHFRADYQCILSVASNKWIHTECTFTLPFILCFCTTWHTLNFPFRTISPFY